MVVDIARSGTARVPSILTFDQAFQYLFSCGVVVPPHQLLRPTVEPAPPIVDNSPVAVTTPTKDGDV
jgi:hypothetical protein